MVPSLLQWAITNTALWQLHADQPHPEMGGGLFCVLQMPHQIKDAKKLAQLIMQLNRMEWAPQDLAPHFGAWCHGRVGMNLAYVSFLPNATTFDQKYSDKRFTMGMVSGALGKLRIGISRGFRIAQHTKCRALF